MLTLTGVGGRDGVQRTCRGQAPEALAGTISAFHTLVLLSGK